MKFIINIVLLAVVGLLNPAFAQVSVPPSSILEQFPNGAYLRMHKLTSEEIAEGEREERLARLTLARDRQLLLALVEITPDKVQGYTNFGGGWGSGATYFYKLDAVLKDGGRCNLGIGIDRRSQMLESRSISCKDPQGNPIADKSIRLLPIR